MLHWKWCMYWMSPGTRLNSVSYSSSLLCLYSCTDLWYTSCRMLSPGFIWWKLLPSWKIACCKRQKYSKYKHFTNAFQQLFMWARSQASESWCLAPIFYPLIFVSSPWEGDQCAMIFLPLHRQCGYSCNLTHYKPLKSYLLDKCLLEQCLLWHSLMVQIRSSWEQNGIQ